MRKFAGNYLSGRVKTKGPADVASDRYDYISVDQAEPNFGVPSNNITALPGTQGTNSFLMTTGAGDRRIVAIGDDLELEQIGTSGDFKLGIAAGATTETISLAQAASNLQSTLQVGMVADRPIQLTNTQDVSDVEVESGSFVTGTVYKITQVGLENWEALDDNPVLVTGINYAQGTLFKANGTGSGAGTSGTSDRGKAVAVPSFSTDGGIELGETLQLQNQKSIVWDGSAVSTNVDNQIYTEWNSNPTSQGNQSIIDFIVGQGDFTGLNSSFSVPTNQSALVLRLKENEQFVSGRQTATIQIGKAVDGESLAGNPTQSSTIIRTNQTLILDPAKVGNTANSGTVTINGNLEVLGTQTTVNSTTLTIADKNIQLADGATTSTLASQAGFTFGEYPSSLTGANGEFVSYSQHTASSDVPADRTPVNATPQLVWETNSAPEHRFKANKKFESTGFLVTGATSGTDVGFIMSDGSVSTIEYEQVGNVTDTTYDLEVNAGTNGNGSIQLTEAGGANDIVDITGSGGIDVVTTVATAQTNALIEIKGNNVAGTTYSLTTTANNTDSNYIDLRIDNLTGTTSSDLVTFKGNNGIIVNSTSDDELIISNSNSPEFIAEGAKITITNQSTSDVLDSSGIDINDLALEASSATSGAVVKFARSTTGDHQDGGVLVLEITDNTDAARNPWISFMNEGTAVSDQTQHCMGEITTKQSDGNDKSGIRIWGQTNIDFDISNSNKPSNSLTERRLSVTGNGLVLHNSSKITFDGGTYDTVLQYTTPTTTRTITFPDESGEVALVGNIEAGGPIATVDGTTDADHFVVFAETAVSTAGTTQDPLTNSSLKFNPHTGELTTGGDISVTGDVSLTGALTATTKSFLIDHPTKDRMKLQYTCLEGPENAVYVRGRLKDSSVIELPDYWVGLVDEDTITVNLTPIGHSQDLYVQDIINNQIIINDNENINCFYTIFAERKDVDKLVVEYEDS